MSRNLANHAFGLAATAWLLVFAAGFGSCTPDAGLTCTICPLDAAMARTGSQITTGVCYLMSAEQVGTVEALRASLTRVPSSVLMRLHVAAKPVGTLIGAMADAAFV
jgi:uncharacterized membrane protein YraQ (UPF0718 family)